MHSSARNLGLPSKPFDIGVLNWLESIEIDSKNPCWTEAAVHDKDPTAATTGMEPQNSLRLGACTNSDIEVDIQASGIGSIQTEPLLSDGSSVSSRGTRDPLYRDILERNHIHFWPLRTDLPKDISKLIKLVKRVKVKLGPLAEDIAKNGFINRLLENGAAESRVIRHIQSALLPGCQEFPNIDYTGDLLILDRWVPKPGSPGAKPISRPKPDLLLGYLKGRSLSEKIGFSTVGNEYFATKDGVLFPFLAIDFKGDGPTGAGSLWVGTNQCLGATASCVNIINVFNSRSNAKSKMIDNAVFGVVMSGTEARLHVAWGESDRYYMAWIDSFLLQVPADFLEFRRLIHQIIDWGCTKRLKKIQAALNYLQED